MQVRARATGSLIFGGGTGGYRNVSGQLLRGALLAGVAYGAMSGIAYAQALPQPDYCADPVQASDVALCDVAQGSMLLDRITVISRTGETAIESMASVSQIDAETLARRMPATANDVFFGTPGIAIQTDARRAGSAANIRGLQDFGRVQVIVDGARQNFNRYGHGTSSMFFVDPNLLESVEVIRGPVANTYGSGAIGGVVMFNTKTADSFLRPGEQYGLETSVNYDTNAHGITGSATGAVRLTENIDVLGNVVVRNFGDYTDGNGDTAGESGFDVLSGLVKATIRPTEYSELNLGWSGSNNEWDEFTEGAMGRPGTPYASDSRQNTYSAQFEYADPDNELIDFHLNASINTIDFNRANLTDISRWSEDAGTFVNVPAGSSTGYDLVTYSFDAWNTSVLDTGPIRHEFTYGGDIVHDHVTTANPISGGGHDPYNPSGDRTLAGLYLQDKATYEWLEIIAGIRCDVYDFSSDSVSNSDSRLSPRVTVGISPFEEGILSGLQAYGTYAEGYRAPAITEMLIDGVHPAGVVFPFLPNPDLRPETARTWEFGINYAADGLINANDALRLKAAYFNNTIDNYIDMNAEVPAGPGCVGSWIGTCSQFQNYDSAEIEGFEIEAMYDQQAWFAGLSASVIDGEVYRNGEVSNLLSVPAAQVTGQLGFRLMDGALTLGGEVQQNWMPDGASADDYTLVNLFASYQASEDVSFNLRVDNLFDETYRNPLNVSTNDPVYEPGFSLKLGATVRF